MNRGNPLYLLVHRIDGFIEEKKEINTYCLIEYCFYRQ